MAADLKKIAVIATPIEEQQMHHLTCIVSLALGMPSLAAAQHLIEDQGKPQVELAAAATFTPSAATPRRVPVGPSGKPLDLRAPDITRIFTPEEIEHVLRNTRDPNTIEEVEVEGAPEKIPPATPNIPGGILSPFWALANPLQGWRIFVPMPPDQARKMGAPLDATDPYREPTLPPQ